MIRLVYIDRFKGGREKEDSERIPNIASISAKQIFEQDKRQTRFGYGPDR